MPAIYPKSGSGTDPTALHPTGVAGDAGKVFDAHDGSLLGPVATQSQLNATEREVTANFTFATSDANQSVASNDPADIIGTLEPHATVALPVGAEILCWRRGAGRFIIHPVAPATIEGFSGDVEIAAQHSGVVLYQSTADNWELAAADGVSPTLLTAKGSLIGASGAGTPVEISVSGTDGNVLTEDSTAPAGVSWKPGGGSSGGFQRDWPIALGSYLANMRAEDAGASVNSVSAGRMVFARLPFFPGKPITQLSFLPHVAMAGLSNQWACVIDAKTKTILAVSPDGGNAALSAGVMVTYVMGSAYVPADGDVLAWGIVLAGTVPSPTLRGRALSGIATAPLFGANAFPPSGIVTAGNGIGATTPLPVGTVLGALSTTGQLAYCEVG